MKKSVTSLLAFVFVLFMTLTVQSQVVVTVGTLGSLDYNSSTSYPSPYGRFKESTHQQILLTAQEIFDAGGMAGKITAIGFKVQNVNACGSLPDYTIKIKTTTSSGILTMDNSGLTTVFNTYSFTPITGWNTHTFSSQFTWNGTSNILIDLCNSVCSPPVTNSNASCYITFPSVDCYVLGTSNTSNQCGSSSVSLTGQVRPTIQLTILPNVPNCAVLSAPSDGAYSMPINTTLSWTNGGSATSYDVYFGTTASPPFKINQTALTYNPGVLQGNTTYYWKIIARNTYGTAVGCLTRSFTTVSACPSNLLPITGSTNIATSQTLSWGTIPSTIKYYIYLGTNSNPPLYDSTASTSYSVSDLMGNTKYYWRIAPRNQAGLVTGCSVLDFTTTQINHWFVKIGGNNSASGNSWDNAKADLAAVLLSAAVGDSIHVAAGTYYPTRDKLNNTLPVDLRDYCFTLNQGVKMIGGYPTSASGSTLQTSLQVLRDPAVNQTILSGNIGTLDSLDNCYHVVWCASGAAGTSVIDGFTITLGYSNGASAQNYNKGGGIYANGGKLTVTNSLLLRNYANIISGAYGGGIYSNACILSIVSTTLISNYSYTEGSAISAYSGSLSIKSSTIMNSRNTVISAVYTESSNVLLIDNSTFWNNVHEDLYINSTSSVVPIISNSTLEKINDVSTISPSINNTICKTVTVSASSPTYRYSIFNSGSTATYYDGSGVSTTGLAAIANWLFTPADNGGPTKTCLPHIYNYQNPAVGMGNPAYAGLTDQRGKVRANPPCVGSVEVSHALASDILINDTTIYAGTSVTLNVHSSTVTTPVFDWFSNATLTTHVSTGSTFTTPALNSNYYYYLTVHNNSILPNPPLSAKKVTIYVTQMPIITQQPLAITKCVSENASLSVASYGSGLSYLWVKNNVGMTGQIGNTLNFTNIQYSDTGYYFCRVTNTYGTTNSDTVKVMVHTVPVAASVITGLSYICAGLNGISYHIPSIPDANTYSWSLPTGATGTSTSENILVNYSNLAESGNITVSGINQCGTGSSTSFPVTIGSFIPYIAGQITGNTLVCQGQSNVTYSIPVIPNASSYIWTLPNGATGTSSTNSITVNYGPSAQSGNITVKGNNLCGDGPASSLQITIGDLLSPAGTISGDPIVCQGQNNVIYNLPLIPNATSYVWTLPSGATGVVTNNSISVNYSTTALSGSITVKGQNSCGYSPVSSLSVSVNNLPSAAGTISGNSTVCQGQNNVTYSLSTIQDATSYVWSLPAGAMGLSSTNTINVSYGVSAQTGNISVQGHNNCGNGENSSLAININPLPSGAGTIFGNTSVCKGQTGIAYSVTPISNATSYAWSLPSGASGTSNTNNIMVYFGTSAISGNITVSGVNSCGNGNSSTLTIHVDSLPTNPGIISGSTSVCKGQNAVIYNVPTIANASAYVWTLPAGATGSSTTNSISVDYGPAAISGNITVSGQNGCGYGAVSTLPITVNSLPTTQSATPTSFTTDFQTGIPTNYVIYNDNHTVNTDLASVFTNGWNALLETSGSTNVVAGSPSYFTPAAQADRWLITPTINPSSLSSLTWRAKSFTSSFAESYVVKISTTGVAKTNFTTTLYSTSATPYSWSPQSVSLAAYAGQSIHIAFIQNSVDKYVLFIDDIGVSSTNPPHITGPANVCQGGSNYVYSVNALQNATSYVWTLPNGMTGTSTTNSITVSTGVNAQSGIIKVRGQNSCGLSDSIVYSVTVTPTPTTPVITLNGHFLISNASSGNQWYNLSSGLISGATNATYNLTQNGYYFVIVTTNGCKSDSSNIIHYTSAGIEDNEFARAVKVYPNPVYNEMTIEVEGNKENIKFEILNTIGQTVFKGNLLEKTTISTLNFAPGVYLIKLGNGNIFGLKKIVKE
jgi:hypothetical protein